MLENEFFPTMDKIADQMVAKFVRNPRNMLEPNAGTGALVEAVNRRWNDEYRRNNVVDIDCIEISPELVAILRDKDFSVIDFDWLSYGGACYYDGIIMNPPFSNGVTHLLKAWDFLTDGEIVCLLNAETILNPFSQERMRLKQIIEDHGNVEFLGARSKDAERSTDVEVVMLYLNKQEPEEDWSHLLSKDQIEPEYAEGEATITGLARFDELGNKERFFRTAIAHFFEASRHMALA